MKMEKEKTQQPIDAIIYWVDGNDPAWQKKRKEHPAFKGQEAGSSRYRDWDNLQYLFRGIEKYAPWINRIFFVSDEQVPPWLNTKHPKLKVVDHKDYIPQEYLPTFSSQPIELNFHRIKGLSEQFIVFNDDFFLTSYISPSDFFQNNMPVDIFMEYPVMCGGNNPVYSQRLSMVFNVIGKYFKRKEYKKRLRKKILSLHYGAYFFYNLIMYMMPFPHFFGLLTPHFARPYLKSSFEEMWEKEPQILDETCKRKYKDSNNVNIYLIRLWNLMKGTFVPGNVLKQGKAFFIHDVDESVCNAIEKQTYKLICINDDCDDQTFNEMKDKIKKAFNTLLPEQSGFERK